MLDQIEVELSRHADKRPLSGCSEKPVSDLVWRKADMLLWLNVEV
jgi:hypothetical protein